MTRARVLAQQAIRPPKGARLLRGTVSAVSPLTVQIAGGGAVRGIPIPGAVYTVGGIVSVLVQEPGVGPVYPLPGTTAVPGVPVSTYGTLDFTGTTCTNQGGISELGRFGDLVTLNAYIGLGATGAVAGTLLGRLPIGYRPRNSRAAVWAIWGPAGWKGSAAVEIGSDGSITAKWLSTPAAANDGIFGSIGFAGA